MADILTPQQRHRCMTRIKATDTRPEMIVRRWLWKEGYRYRLHAKNLPGKPDIVLRKIRTVIFINGCFWHGHNVKGVDGQDQNYDVIEMTDSECCKIPNTNREFWLKKIRNNRFRDSSNYSIYQSLGWNVLVVWECMLKPKMQINTLKALSLNLSNINKQQKRYSDEEDYSVPYVADAEIEYDITK